MSPAINGFRVQINRAYVVGCSFGPGYRRGYPMCMCVECVFTPANERCAAMSHTEHNAHSAKTVYMWHPTPVAWR